MIDFDGQVAVVTGAGRGLGRLYPIELARRGASVVVNDLGGTMHGDGADESVTDQVVDEITAAGGSAAASYHSVDSPEGGEAIVQTALESFGRLDAVISNAGIFNSIPFDELTPDDWRRMLRVHLDGAFYLAQPAYRVMKKQNYGRFVFIASSAGMFGQHLEAHYAAAKSGIVGLTNVIALEGEPHGILANSVLPFGFSRMVTETLGDPKALKRPASYRRSDLSSSRRWWCIWQAGRASSATTTTRPSVAASPACSSASARAGWPSPVAIRPSTTSPPSWPRSRRPNRSQFPARSTKRSLRCRSGWASGSPEGALPPTEPVDEVGVDTVGDELPSDQIACADPSLALPLAE